MGIVWLYSVVKGMWDQGTPLFRGFMVGIVLLFVLVVAAYAILFPRWTHLTCEGDCVPLAIGETIYEEEGGLGISITGTGESIECGDEMFYAVPISVINPDGDKKQATTLEFLLVDSAGQSHPADRYPNGCHSDSVLDAQWVPGGYYLDLYLWFNLGKDGTMPAGKTTIIWEPDPAGREPAFFVFNSS